MKTEKMLSLLDKMDDSVSACFVVMGKCPVCKAELLTDIDGHLECIDEAHNNKYNANTGERI